jgi:ABC-type glycerol-3-phosphate transport system permease component
MATVKAYRRTAWLLRKASVEAFFYALMSALAVIFLLPLVWMVGASLNTEDRVLSIPPTFFPIPPRFENYLEMWQANIFPIFFYNSVKLAFLNVVGTLFFSSLAAYAFARLNFVGRDVVFSILLSTIMIPGTVTLIPLYIIYRNIGWIDTHYPLWLPHILHSTYSIFLLRQFFKTLPQELEDAAKIDGCSSFRIYWQIMLPQIKPAMAAIGIFTFLGSWNDLFGPLIFLNSTELQTLPVGLAMFRREFFTELTLLMAGSTLTILPVLVIYFSAQKYFIQGIALTGIKG